MAEMDSLLLVIKLVITRTTVDRSVRTGNERFQPKQSV